MRTMMIYAAALVLVACGGGDGGGGARGPAAAFVRSGNNQPTNAVKDSLVSPVAVQLVRLPPSPGMALRLSDFVIRPAYAQTSVQGIPGQTVCAEPLPDSANTPGSGMTAWNRCATTDSEGFASFFFNPPTKVGTQCAEIRGVVNNQPVIPDTACAVVEAGPAYDSPLRAPGVVDFGSNPRGRAVTPPGFLRDRYGNEILPTYTTSAFLLAVPDTFGGVSPRVRPALTIAPEFRATVSVGDTATVLIYQGETLVSEAEAKLVAIFAEPFAFIVDLRPRTLNLAR